MTFIYLNDEFIDESSPTISHKDCGFSTGIGVFDTMLTKDGSLIYAQKHYERLSHDVKAVIDLPLYMTLEKFEKNCLALLEKNKLTRDCARLRTTVTGGIVKAALLPATTPTVLIQAVACPDPATVEPVTCAIIKDYPRIANCALENCKRLDYSRSYAARRKAETLGAEEAILTNTDGNIACGATSNLFIEENGVLITPPLNDGVLAGITRRKLIEERNVREESISEQRLRAADTIYLTNSFIELRLVNLIKI